ncbi:MAG: hypothetical protein NZ740_01165 [Kiritimatiellae bacterium]|nr:hypothetical protein [Kiritimatiellia bacterium]MDW8457700.1 hypothetical protein [Verrucomicrobiota bacterium]
MNASQARWWIPLAMCLALGTPAAQAQRTEYELSDEELLEEGLVKREDPFELFLGVGTRVYLFQHSALQTRMDRQVDSSSEWRDGDVNGNGWGLSLGVARKSTRISGTIVSSDYDYKLRKGKLRHDIQTERRDFDLIWEEQSGQSERARWGWLLGARYITLDERFGIVEGSKRLDRTGSVEWFLAQAGYWGSIQPFYRKFMNVYGSTRVFLGEAEGLARSGSDKAIDGKIEQTYKDDYSLAYGWDFTVGLSLRIRDTVGVHTEYFRHYLYSFDSTDSGIVVFPDNSDALFIDEVHGVHLYLSVIW